MSNLIPVYLSVGQKGENQNWETRSQTSVSTPIFPLNWDFQNKARETTGQSYIVRNELQSWCSPAMTGSNKRSLKFHISVLHRFNQVCPTPEVLQSFVSWRLLLSRTWGNPPPHALQEPGQSSDSAAGTHCTSLCRTRSCWTTWQRFICAHGWAIPQRNPPWDQ